MAIIAIDPPNWQQFNVVQLDSDAARNEQAITEIDTWAFNHGFARVTEYFLRIILKADGKRVFRGICYRLTPEETHSAEASCQSSAEVMSKMAYTAPGSDDDC
jgi:hypothetical protein